jgi:hypothetical protein
MNDVRQAIRRAAEARPIPIANLERVRRTLERRKMRRRITAGGVAFLVAAAGLVLVVSALREIAPNRTTPGTAGPLDPATLRYAWSARIENASLVGEVSQTADRIYIPTASGVIVYPKQCSDPCRPLWRLDLVDPGVNVSQTPSLALGDDVIAVSAGGRLAIAPTDCAVGGQPCQALWYADPPPGSSGYVGAVIADGVVKVTANEGDAPHNIHTAVAFDLRCRDDGGECTPLWSAELGPGAAHFPAPAVDGVFYQQVGTKLLGFLARCRTDGGRCDPDFVIEASGDPYTQQSSLFGPVARDGALVIASGDGNVYGYPEHCRMSCNPTWIASIADHLESYPLVAGDLVVVSHDGGLTAVPFSCAESDGRSCAPAWRADLDGYWSVEYADGDVVVAADRFRGSERLAVLAANCAGSCQPLWTVGMGEQLNGVASDGTSIFASEGRRVLAYPAACTDRCAPVWTADLEGAAWQFLIDDKSLVVTSQLGSDGVAGLDLTVFAGGSRVPSEDPYVIPSATGFVIASGETDGGPWQITLYPARLTEPTGETATAWCLDLDAASVGDPSAPESQQANMCSLGDEQDEPIGPVALFPGFRDEEALLYGQVSSEVAHLELVLEGQEAREVAIAPGPEETGLPVGFFATFVAAADEIEIVARDGVGEILERKRIGGNSS